MIYAQRLQMALALAGRTQGELAIKLGVSPQAISKVCNQRSASLTAENNAQAARALGVDQHWLATGEGEARPAPPKAPMSPLALDIGNAFDKLPTAMRDRVYAQIMGTIDLATALQQPTTRLGDVSTPPRQRG